MGSVDTNIQISSISPQPEDARKCAVAVTLLQAQDLALTVQVLQEFYVQVEAARAASCRQILSEDLNPGQDYDGLLVVNPFVP